MKAVSLGTPETPNSPHAPRARPLGPGALATADTWETAHIQATTAAGNLRLRVA